eukprot:Phypoly_transcript_01512.p1 GENE.Phypoly_transcript_01512~~Phypoly_transcript_01512.p1  ORF type:complete len:1104 (+),score=195.39 Phypoly_transcript_01512:246-3314(+)
MERIIRAIFPPGVKIETNARAVHGIVNANGSPMEIDVYLPDYKLGFEYQDPHHYFHTNYGKVALTEYKERDKMKKEYSHKKGITLLSIPFWWDWKPESLVATVQKERSDVLKGVDCKGALPLSQDPPQHVIDKWNYEVPGLGVPMLASDIPTGRSFTPLDWWACEKFDGARAIWNPTERVFYTRWGTPLSILPAISDTMSPFSMLDGEIWFGRERGMRYQATKISSSDPHLVLWKNFKFMVFDCPQANLLDEPYSTRYLHLQNIIPPDHNYVKLVTYEVCKSREQLEDIFLRVLATGGEGVMLREPKAGYLHGYSPFLYKHKGFRDAEALVIKKISDTRYLCRVAKFTVRNRGYDPEKLKSYYENPTLAPQTGAPHKSHKFSEIAKDHSPNLQLSNLQPPSLSPHSLQYPNLPSHALQSPNPNLQSSDPNLQSPDLQSPDLRSPNLQSPNLQSPNIQSPNLLHSETTLNYTVPPHNNQLNLEMKPNFSELKTTPIPAPLPPTHQMDQDSASNPLPNSIPHQLNIQTKSFSQTSTQTPHQHSDNKPIKKSDSLPHSAPTSADFYTLEMELDDKLSPSDIGPIKEGTFVSFKYLGETTGFGLPLHPKIYAVRSDVNKWEQLLHARRNPPEHKKIWGLQTQGDWTELSSRRAFFDEFARENHFDPLIPENWYKITKEDILEKKGSHGIAYYSSIPNALLELYPDIGLELHNFKHQPKLFWTDKENCKVFLEKLAFAKHFDPLVPDNWYTITPKDFTAIKGGTGILQHYRGSVADAILDSYSFIGLDPEKLYSATKLPKEERARKFFDEYAAKHNFDPLVPENWYKVSHTDLLKYSSKAEEFTRNSSAQALIAAYPTIGLQANRFHFISRNFWADIKNSKQFLDDFASAQGFDPLLPHNWYPISATQLLRTKGGYGMLEQFQNSLASALQKVYPNIGINPSLFKHGPNPSKIEKERMKTKLKTFFDSLANRIGFDPQDTQKWQAITANDVTSLKGGAGIVRKYRGNFLKAIADAYPNIGVQWRPKS